MRLLRPCLALAAVSTLAGCGGSGSANPTTPPPAQGSVIHLVDPAGALSAHEETILMVAQATLDDAAAVLNLDGLTVTIDADASRAIAGYGVGGFTPNGREIEISIDSRFPGLEAVLPERLATTVAHEAHHAARWRGPGYGTTLLEAMVTEGLADHFAVERLGVPIPPWSEAVAREETAAFIEQARPHFDSTSYGHSRWFFGTDPALPRWLGYTLGFRLVEAYQLESPGTSAAELVHTPAHAFRP